MAVRIVDGGTYTNPDEAMAEGGLLESLHPQPWAQIPLAEPIKSSIGRPRRASPWLLREERKFLQGSVVPYSKFTALWCPVPELNLRWTGEGPPRVMGLVGGRRVAMLRSKALLLLCYGVAQLGGFEQEQCDYGADLTSQSPTSQGRSGRIRLHTRTLTDSG
ncbi:hypothetical protein R1flu_006099 [Riccia fluitans]|uniref:Uncharacterized protein n=1 Tax=Riccia fluitans TaxID=41844 RepID=A0ABD1YVC5_9MARC